jgi:tRNA modification GTPase
VVSGTGIAELYRILKDQCALLTAHDAAGAILGSERQRRAVAAALRYAEAAERALAGGAEELASLDVRHAAGELAGMVGTVRADEILDEIFSRFCIGK